MTECFRCGDDDHLSYDCPRHTREQSAPARPPASGQAPANGPASRLPGYGQPIPPRKAPEEIADYAVYVRKAWAELGWQGEVVCTPFRERAGFPLRTEDDMRAIAIAQLRDQRKDQ